MNEKQLKRLFWSGLNSGHIGNNTVIPGPETADLRIIEEANFRSFDLLIAAISRSANDYKSQQGDHVLMRTRLHSHFARLERCTADRIQFYPVEIKSDKDRIDERLPNQVIDAILTFGLSIVVFDKNHSRRIRSKKSHFVLPATIICYSGHDDYFEVMSVFDRFVSSGIFNFHTMNLARLLKATNVNESAKASRRLASLQQIMQKIVFSQLHFESPGLTEEEQQFVCAFANVKPPRRERMLGNLRRETTNAKLTDYLQN